MWEKSPLFNSPKSWSNALIQVETLNTAELGGFTDWRLPNANELESLVNAGVPDNEIWLAAQGFTNLMSGFYWSSTGNATEACVLWLSYCNFYLQPKDNVFNTWAVRGGQGGTVRLPRTGQFANYEGRDDGALQKGGPWPSPRFTNNGNGTVTDNLTGLMWERQPLDLGRTWAEALAYADGLTTGGYSDWRLPNRREIGSLANFGVANTAAWLNTQGFANVQGSNTYWTSTTWSNDTAQAWMAWVNFGCAPSPKTGQYYAWAVRDR
jgi:hypothetical protein